MNKINSINNINFFRKIACIRIIQVILLCMITSSCIPAIFVAGTGAIASSASKGGVKTYVRDSLIHVTISKDFMKKGFREVYVRIKMEVFNGKVLLIGSLDDEKTINSIIDIVRSNKSVIQVLNELTVDKSGSKFSAEEYSRDTFITSLIKSKLLKDQDIIYIRYTVITDKGVVYLIGKTDSEEELNKVAKISSSIKGVKKVISYVEIY